MFSPLTIFQVELHIICYAKSLHGNVLLKNRFIFFSFFFFLSDKYHLWNFFKGSRPSPRVDPFFRRHLQFKRLLRRMFKRERPRARRTQYYYRDVAIELVYGHGTHEGQEGVGPIGTRALTLLLSFPRLRRNIKSYTAHGRSVAPLTSSFPLHPRRCYYYCYCLYIFIITVIVVVAIIEVIITVVASFEINCVS